MHYLRLVTGVDRLAAGETPGRIEMVYHLWSYEKRHGVVLRVHLDRDNPVVDTVCDVWPVANWGEREAFDLLGVTFPGHPNLTRIMMPVDWVGHPLRKDYERPDRYHGLPTNRAAVLAQGRVAVATAEHDGQGRAGERLHAAQHGAAPPGHPRRDQLPARDRRRDPAPGHSRRRLPPPRHREDLRDRSATSGTMPYTDRVDYLGAMFTNHGWALAVEKLCNIEVPRRAEFCRVIASELNRIASHQIATGALAMDLGRVHPVPALDPRARDDQRHHGADLRRAPDLQLHALRRRRRATSTR